VFSEDTLDPGIFTFDRVVDGDTIRIKEIDKSLRLLCVDTEEVFKSNAVAQKELAEKDWKEYLKIQYKKKSIHPPKYASPLGEEASEFAKSFFDGVEKVKIEFDSLDRVRDFFNRSLVYVFALKNGVWVNFNVELVRNGLSPYYMKYGGSKRYQDDFLNAEKEARKKKVGVWNPRKKHFPDYPERISWWKGRADAIRAFEEKAGSDDSFFFIQNDTDWRRLKEMDGKTITVFGTVDRVKSRGKPHLIYMSHQEGHSIIIYTDDDKLFELAKKKYLDEQYVTFTGKLEFVDDDFRMEFIESAQIRSTEADSKKYTQERKTA